MAETVGLALRALVLLLETRSEALELIGRLIDLLIRLLLLFPTALHALVLVAQLLTIELEEVGEVLRALSGATATTSATAHADTHIPEHRLGALQLLERALLRRQRRLRVTVGELLLRRVHDRRRLVQDLRDLGEIAVACRDPAIDDASRELFGLAAQFLLRHTQRRQVLLELLRLLGRLVAHRIERPGNDLALLLRELPGVVVASASATTPSLILFVVLGERTHLEEIDIGRRRLRPAHRIVVGGARIVRDHVSGLELEVLEREGVAGGHLRRTSCRAVQGDRLFRRTVHRIHELQLLDAVIILGLNLRVHFIDV